MKKIFTLAAILFSITTFAAPGPNDSKVAIRSNSDAYIQVYIDGKQYNVNQNGFAFDNIRSGRHQIEVYKIDNYGRFRKRPQRVYSNVTFVKPWESLNINIDRSECVLVQTRLDRDDHRGGYNGGGYDRGGYDRDYGRGPVYNDRDDRNRH
ncbi:hypothetical protein A4H97_01935 [Niastella yeongjuensis]|uniref:PEGA domain-containing protein n=1 Tax=Niastella yeongjuensis TaxID=354355 RepID=A0A1V9EWX0_9BACT|nr:hypothetical protein [Niastella yeongjuensis]OQP50623.1 hypothetical protein A4H97_01935 [Niastella yeongjuensis]SEN25596.1 hypothetical protein SAMN05660816_00558 [Niastella yeongjuensis]